MLPLVLSFDGKMAGSHELDIRQLGESLIGIHRLVSVGIFVLETGSQPRLKNQLPLSVVASEPKKGSFELAIHLVATSATLPLLYELYLTSASDIIYRWLSGALMRMAGRNSESYAHFSELVNLMDKIDARRHLEIIEWQKLWDPGKKVVSTIGNSCESISFPSHGDTELDLPVAEAIRSRGKLVVGDMNEYEITVDGVINHNRQIKIPHLSEHGKFMTAYIRDPAFDQSPNIYTDALIHQRKLRISAKPSMTQDGKIRTLYILNATEVEDDNA